MPVDTLNKNKNDHDISMSSHDIKIAIATAIEEKKRRVRENGIKYYIPQEAKDGCNAQGDFHRSNKRIRAVFGGNRSGKSNCGAAEAVWYALGTHPYKNIPTPNYGRVICTDFTNGIEKVIIPEMKKLLPKDMIESFNMESRTYVLKNGSTIEFMSYDQDVEKFASASRHWIWFDEEPPQDIFNENKMRLIDTNGDMWFTLTPVSGMSWIYSDIYERAGLDKNIDIYTFDTRLNPYLNKEAIKQLSEGFSEAELDMRLGGKFVSLSGLIYKEYKDDTHAIKRFKLPDNWVRICAIDPHPRIPSVVVYMAVAPLRNLITLCSQQNITLPPIVTPDNQNGNKDKNDEEIDVYIVYDEVYPAEPTLISDVAKLMHVKEGRDYIQYRLIDNSANTNDPIIGTTVREEFERNDIRTVLADKDVANRIFRVRERLQTNRILFFNDLHNTLWEIKHYVWDDYRLGKDSRDPKEKPRKKRDHAMDCIGYMCISNPRSTQAEVYRPDRKTADSYTGY